METLTRERSLQLTKTGNRNVASARRVQKRIFGNVSHELKPIIWWDIYPLCWMGQWIKVIRKK
jgi:hypothetical protein